MRRLAAACAAALGLVLAPVVPAGAAEIVEMTVPSRHVDPAQVSFNGADHPRELRVNVLLPDGYDGRRRFPVLYLLHGVGDNWATWAREDRGDVLRTTEGLGAIVVMPEAARGFYTSWWNGGRRGEPGWERYYLDELVPELERRLRILPGRSNHAIAGLSMGGMGSTFLGSQLPGYFGSVASFSGFVSHQRPEVEAGLRAVGGVEYEQVFGPMDGFYATGHNPTRLVANLRATRVYLTVGDGTPAESAPPQTVAGGGAVEAGLRQQAEDFVAAARAAGVDVTYVPLQGIHDWPYWRRHLREAIAWGLFRPVDEEPGRWEYATVAQRGEMWGIGYEFAAPPETVERFEREGETLRGSGSGAATLTAGRGCSFAVELPFERALPPAACGALRVVARPRALRAGRSTIVRASVTTLTPEGRRVAVRGATVRVAGRRARTNGRGRAAVRLVPRRAGRTYVRAARDGLRSGRALLRVER
jgi:S-formylglutathione hydrolase FrmB